MFSFDKIIFSINDELENGDMKLTIIKDILASKLLK
jgi:hypothetical protein